MKSLVQAYRTSAGQLDREQLVTDHLCEVGQILGRILVTIPDTVDRENLLGAGFLGLVEAAGNYDPSRNVSFSAYARLRIRGAIIDELRRNCPIPQHMQERWKEIRQAVSESGEPASVESIVRITEFTEKEVEECIAAVRLIDPEEYQDDRDIPRAAEISNDERADVLNKLVHALEQLEERQRAIVIMYYREEMRLREIGEVMEISESRVSRLLQQAHRQLRLYFERQN